MDRITSHIVSLWLVSFFASYLNFLSLQSRKNLIQRSYVSTARGFKNFSEHIFRKTKHNVELHNAYAGRNNTIQMISEDNENAAAPK